jgi:predicted 2-oxoglutarate/Fe(II)-dependent dioxygenase YbiX
MNYNSGWYIDTAINNDLIQYCNSVDGIWEQQYGVGRAKQKGSNVHNAFRLNIDEDNYNVLNEFLFLDNYKIFGAYILKYGPNSFTGMHQDNSEESQKTSITLIEQSNDIVGGKAIITDNMGAPIIVEQQVGQTLWYDQSLWHGVSKIEKGERKVLVTWWKNNAHKQI